MKQALRVLKEGQRLRILLSAIAGGTRHQPIRVIIANDSTIEAAVAHHDGDAALLDRKSVV